jgi:hypothetical protein
MFTKKSEKILVSCIESIGKTAEDFNSVKPDLKVVNLNKSVIDDLINQRLLTLQGLTGNVNLITARYAEKNGIKIDGLKTVKLCIVQNGQIARYYSAYVQPVKSAKKIEPEKISVAPLKVDNTRTKQSLTEKVKSLINPEPVLQLAETETTRIDSLECKLNRIESMLETILSTKK